MRFGGRIPLVLAVIGALVLAGCGGTDDGGGGENDTGNRAKPVSQPEWRLTDPPTAFEEEPVAKVYESAYAAGDVVFATSLDGFTMHDGRTGKLLWEHGQDIDDEPILDPHLFRMVTGSGPLYLGADGAAVYAATRTLDEDLEEQEHSLTAFDGATGEVESSRPITVANGSAEVVAVTDDIVLLADGDVHDDFTVGSDFILRGIGRTSATQVWTREDFAPVGISGTTLVGLDYRGSDTLTPEKIVAIDLATGKDLWTAAGPAQAIDPLDEALIRYVGGRSVVVTVSRDNEPGEATVILDATSGKVVASRPFAVDQCVGATTIAACSTSTEPPFFFDPATGESVAPLVKTDEAKVTAITDDACYVEVDDVGQVIAVGSGKRLSDGQQVLPVQLGNGYALTEPGNFWEIYRGQ